MANSNDLGPTYADVAELAERIKTDFGLRVLTEVHPPGLLRGKYERAWVVQVSAYRLVNGDRQIVQGSMSAYGGHSGTRTMPAAMFGAMQAVYWGLEDAGNAAAQQAAF